MRRPGRSSPLPEVQEKLDGIGAETMPLAAAALGAYLATEIARWTAVVRAARIAVD